ncbi:MAG: glycosyltransferase [Bacteroidetes bacterium]|nr:glycosyltransferase [Bacteroidota bacterium]
MIQLLFYSVAFITLVTGAAYAYIVLKVATGWKKIPVFEPGKYLPSTSVSVIIAARNEEKNILSCLDSLIKQDYPKHLFEIIVVDDDSSDSTALLVQVAGAKNSSVKIKLFKAAGIGSSGGGKKNALKIGIANSTGKLIVTTDADCVMNNQWLSAIVGFYEQHQPKMIMGPVATYGETSGFGSLQSMELMALMAFSGVFCRQNTPIMSNGANLAYERSAFTEAGGFDGIDHIASGDDVLLMDKFVQKFPGQVKFLRSQAAIVSTKVQRTFGGFLYQRMRWASKGMSNISTVSASVAILISGINIVLFFNLVLSFFYGKFAGTFLALLSLKFIADHILLSVVSVFFNKQVRTINILVSQFVQYCVNITSWNAEKIRLERSNCKICLKETDR